MQRRSKDAYQDGRRVPTHDPYMRRYRSGSGRQQVGRDPHYSSRGNHMFPYGLDYIFILFFIRCRALIWYYSTRLLNPVVSEPSTEASVAWLLIGIFSKTQLQEIPLVKSLFPLATLLRCEG